MKNKRKQITKTILLIIGIAIIPLLKLHAEDLRSVVRFSSYWKFSIGDRPEWSSATYDDSDWDEIRIGRSWERQGYDGYNGYAWYRQQFKLSSYYDSQMYVVISNIDDCDEVFINGELVGSSGGFPPYFSTAYGNRRKYLIPDHVLKPGEMNTIAVRVYDQSGEGGIVGDRTGIFIDEDIEFLNLNLTGVWKFKPGNNSEWKDTRYDDNDWDEIYVPASWESQGYEEYDGYAWYRKEFYLPSSLEGETLYISLGKIDDYDRVYINGKEIGEVFDLEKDVDYPRKGYEYNARRVYEIPDDLLSDQSNTIAIRVYDERWQGGIYEGPIGLMDEANRRDYRKKYHESRGFWDYVLDKFSN
jgi:hypothetical protein